MTGLDLLDRVADALTPDRVLRIIDVMRDRAAGKDADGFSLILTVRSDRHNAPVFPSIKIDLRD